MAVNSAPSDPRVSFVVAGVSGLTMEAEGQRRIRGVSVSTMEPSMYDTYLEIVELHEKALAARIKVSRARRLAARTLGRPATTAKSRRT